VYPARARWAAHATVVAAIFAVVYRYWLLAPVLQRVSVSHWRLIAIVVAAMCGGGLSLLRVSMSALSCGTIAGLLFGGTWAELKAPNDIRVSVYDAFATHLESFWWEILILTFAASLAAFCCAYLVHRRARAR